MKRLLHIALVSCLIGLFAVPMSGQDKEDAAKKKKPKISGAAWKKIGNLTKKKRSFQVEKATTVAGVRGAEAEDEVLKHLYYRGGTAAPSRLELKNAIEMLIQKKAHALIIDLRANGGGILQTAVQSADLFLDHETIVTVQSEQNKKIYRAVS